MREEEEEEKKKGSKKKALMAFIKTYGRRKTTLSFNTDVQAAQKGTQRELGALSHVPGEDASVPRLTTVHATGPVRLPKAPGGG